MVIDRKNLKMKAKDAFKSNYAACVVVALLMVFLATGITVNTSFTDSLNGSLPQVNLNVGGGLLCAVFLIDVFVINPLKVGGYSFFLKNNKEKTDIKEITSGFKTNYANNVVTMLLQDIFLALWTCLLIVPGIIKMYSYSLVPFILSENPEMQPTEAITKSREMMNGYKWQTFVLDLSFIGWGILSVITCGLVGLLYTNPYIYQTKAELYEFIKENK